MNDDLLAQIERTLRGIKHALWAMTLMLALLIVLVAGLMALPSFLLTSAIKSGSLDGQITNSQTASASPAPASSQSRRPVGYYNGFADWPAPKKVAEASVIVVTRYVKDGDSVKQVIAEILKQAPDAKFSYRVGDEFWPFGKPRKLEQVGQAEGAIVFLVGSPAYATFSRTYSAYEDAIDSQCDDADDMTIKHLRELVRASTVKPQEKP